MCSRKSSRSCYQMWKPISLSRLHGWLRSWSHQACPPNRISSAPFHLFLTPVSGLKCPQTLWLTTLLPLFRLECHLSLWMTQKIGNLLCADVDSLTEEVGIQMDTLQASHQQYTTANISLAEQIVSYLQQLLSFAQDQHKFVEHANLNKEPVRAPCQPNLPKTFKRLLSLLKSWWKSLTKWKQIDQHGHVDSNPIEFGILKSSNALLLRNSPSPSAWCWWQRTAHTLLTHECLNLI